MKQPFTYLLIFLCVGFTFAQEQPVYIGNQVEQMAVFPGCEKVDNSDKKALAACMSEQLSERLKNELDSLEEVFRQSGILDAQAKIQFVISREGIIIGIEPMEGSNAILSDATSLAMEKIARELPPIRPAMLKNGQPVNLVFQLPIRYKIEEKTARLVGEFPVDEIVLFTLLTDEKDLRYEVRWFKNKDIKVYEIRENQPSFLGKFLTLNELENSEPYKSLIDKSKASDKILVADGFLDQEFYEIYIHNLFDPAQRKPIFVEVVQIENKKTKSVFKFQTESEFNNSKFVSLIYRD